MKKDRQGKGGIRAAKKLIGQTALGGRRRKGPMVTRALGHPKRLKTSLPLVPSKKEKSSYSAAFTLTKRRHDTEQVVSLLRHAQRQGDGRATYALATWYLHGVHFARNPRKAFLLLQSAAKEGVPEAMFDLAYSYEIGLGAPRSQAKAVQLYIRAALLGDRQAVAEVVRCVYYGVGVSRNKEIAILIRYLAGRRK